MLRVACAAALAAGLAGTGLAFGASDAGGPRNLVATPRVKAALRSGFLTKHPTLPPASVRGPLRGLTYYGSYRGTEYAVATFSIPRFGTQDQPEVFRRPAGGRWNDLGDTGGDVCPGVVPLPLLKLWHFVPTSQVSDSGKKEYCYGPGP